MTFPLAQNLTTLTELREIAWYLLGICKNYLTVVEDAGHQGVVHHHNVTVTAAMSAI